MDKNGKCARIPHSRENGNPVLTNTFWIPNQVGNEEIYRFSIPAQPDKGQGYYFRKNEDFGSFCNPTEPVLKEGILSSTKKMEGVAIDGRDDPPLSPPLQ